MAPHTALTGVGSGVDKPVRRENTHAAAAADPVVGEFLTGFQFEKVSSAGLAVDEVSFRDVITVTTVVAHGACHLLHDLFDDGPGFDIVLSRVVPADPQGSLHVADVA